MEIEPAVLIEAAVEIEPSILHWVIIGFNNVVFFIRGVFLFKVISFLLVYTTQLNIIIK